MVKLTKTDILNLKRLSNLENIETAQARSKGQQQRRAREEQKNFIVFKNKNQFNRALRRQEARKEAKPLIISKGEQAIFKERNLKKYNIKDNNVLELSPHSSHIYLKTDKELYLSVKRKNTKYKQYQAGQLEVEFLFRNGRHKQRVKGLSYKYNNIEAHREQAYNDCLRMALAIYGRSPDDIEVLSENYVYYVRR